MRIWTDYLALTAILYNEFLVTYYDKLYYSLSVVIIGTSFIQITIKPKVANLLFLLLQPLKSWFLNCLFIFQSFLPTWYSLFQTSSQFLFRNHSESCKLLIKPCSHQLLPISLLYSYLILHLWLHLQWTTCIFLLFVLFQLVYLMYFVPIFFYALFVLA